MSILQPPQAAKIANDVYQVQLKSSQDTLIKQLKGDQGSKISLDNQNFCGFHKEYVIKNGKSGFGKESGFAYMANGSGERQNESLIAIRGTDSLADWVTDFKCGFDNSPGGYVVHKGFAETFKSMQGSIDSFISMKGNESRHFHLVGHSLGGALACLAAEYLRLREKKVTLYTFGCPRVGDGAYSSALDELIGIQNIHRVYHEADPVSMGPLYPFVPVSNSKIGHQLPWKGCSISFPAHKMENYIDSVKDCTWESLLEAQKTDFFSSSEVWLSQVGNGGGSIQMFSSSVLRQILNALKWVLSLVVDISAMQLQFMASGAATVVDVLAYLLYQGILTNVTIATHVTYILIAILRFLGRKDTSFSMSPKDITNAFIRYILDMFSRTISSTANQALHLVHRVI